MSSNIEITKTCRWCGKEFIARKTSTEYCSHRCSGLAYKERKRQKKLQEFHDEYARTKPGGTAEVEHQEFLTPIQLSRLLGICRASIYNYISVGVIKTLRLRGKTLIRRKDVEAMFDSPPTLESILIRQKEREPISEFYTSKEVQEKFGISNSALYEIANRENWPKTQSRGKTLWSRKHVDAYFNRIKPDENISEWYTASEIQEKFGIPSFRMNCTIII